MSQLNKLLCASGGTVTYALKLCENVTLKQAH